MNPASVVDASFVIAFLSPDENATEPNDAFERANVSRTHRMVAPTLLTFEVVNGLRSSVIRGRIDEQTALILIERFFDLKIELLDVDMQSAFRLAQQYSLSVYDAVYLALSRATGYPLLTLDKRLRKLCP